MSIDITFNNMAAGFQFNDKMVTIRPYSLIHAAAYVAFAITQNCLSFWLEVLTNRLKCKQLITEQATPLLLWLSDM